MSLMKILRVTTNFIYKFGKLTPSLPACLGLTSNLLWLFAVAKRFTKSNFSSHGILSLSSKKSVCLTQYVCPLLRICLQE